MRAHFKVIEQPDGHIHLIDESNKYGTLTITNDAEAVVQHVVDTYGNRRITYTDTNGDIDELAHENGEFVGFLPGSQGLDIEWVD